MPKVLPKSEFITFAVSSYHKNYYHIRKKLFDKTVIDNYDGYYLVPLSLSKSYKKTVKSFPVPVKPGSSFPVLLLYTPFLKDSICPSAIFWNFIHTP